MYETRTLDLVRCRSVNRDTDHRTGVVGECNWDQTGKPDGTYIIIMSAILHN